MLVWLVTLLSLTCFGLHGQEPAQKGTASAASPYVERSQKEFDFYPGGKLELTAAVPGNVRIAGWKRPTVRLETERIIYYLEPDQARVLAEQFPIQTRWTQTLAKIATLGPDQGTAAMEINLSLLVPEQKTDMIVRISKGDLSFHNINGWVEATIGEGNLEANSMQGYFSGTTEAGNLSVEMTGRRWNGHGFTAVTQRGTVNLRLPVEYSAALQLETHGGDLVIDYPEQVVDGQHVPLHFITRNEVRNLTATVGQGGAPVKLFTSAGDILLSKIP